MQNADHNVTEHNPDGGNLPVQSTQVDVQSTQADKDRAEFDAWKAKRDTEKADAEPKDKPVKGEEDRNLTGEKATYKSSGAAGKTSRDDVTLLHDKIVAVFKSAGIAWPKDNETPFHTLTEDDYSEGDGLADDQPRHAGELPTE